MKILKFESALVPRILSGEKSSTWRMFDDKNLSEGDQLLLVDRDTRKEFGKAEIVSIREKKLGEVTVSDFEKHELYQDSKAMLQKYREYYGDQVTLETPIKIIEFKLV